MANNNRSGSIVYFLLGIYTAIISWYYYHSILWLIINWIFWPISLIYFIVTGHLSNNKWQSIPAHFFK